MISKKVEQALPHTKRFLTVKEAAAYLGIGEWAMRNLVFKGALPFARIGKRVQLDLADLDDFAERSKERYGGR